MRSGGSGDVESRVVRAGGKRVAGNFNRRDVIMWSTKMVQPSRHSANSVMLWSLAPLLTAQRGTPLPIGANDRTHEP